MKLKLLAGAALAALAVAGAASAEQANGWYGALDLGANTKSDYKASSQYTMVDGGPFVYNIGTKDNVVGFARLGYRYSPNWRVELEGGVRPGTVDSAIGFPRSYQVGPNTVVNPTALCTPGVIRGASDACGHPDGILISRR
jgi:OOP family OmpA-OmpF porin